ncbi:MAG TPA: VWA domain-containing protein, partial [Pyrinomonadaceae bacterium]|nr:VWA domain-containing protein [Pyrinomonadaceae bacterium]
YAQQNPPPPQTDDILRIRTELVQTDVSVFDKQGRFVEGLKPEQFELSLDGKPQAISFFERVTAGSSTEAAQLTAVRSGGGGGDSRGASIKNGVNEGTTSTAPDQGRVIFFFVDDLHTSGASMIHAREALQDFVENQLRPDDQAAIVSASGQIGFLQQLTDNQTVLRAAIKRLGYKQNPEAYTGKTQISEYAASQVLDYGNRELYAYLLESIKIEQQMGPGSRHGDHHLAASYSAAPYLKNRLYQVNNQGRMTTADTLDSLRSLMLSSGAIPGRKLVFFLSDGFLVNERKAGALQMLHSVTEAAARAGAVVYTMDLRGTTFGLGSGVDASTNDYIDLTARRSGVASGELSATREPLQLIADETGGRAIFNSNSIGDVVLQAIKETSRYYLLAWRPDGEVQREARSRIKIGIKDHPELRVRLRNSFYSPAPVSNARDEETGSGKESKAKAASPSSSASAEAELLGALGSLYPRRSLPVALSVGYLNASGNSFALRVSMELERKDLDTDEHAGKAEVDVAGVALDDRGQFASFKQLLTVVPESSRQPVVWHQQLNVKPGLYQVRVAVRDRASGRMGSAMTWVEVPDPNQSRLQMSSLFLGERRVDAATSSQSVDAAPQAVSVDVDHRFSRSSVLRFQTYLYNAARGVDGADVWVQAEVFRNRQKVMSIAPGKAPLTSEPSRLPYWSEISLTQLPPGLYTLQVTATDRVGKASASQRINFFIE